MEYAKAMFAYFLICLVVHSTHCAPLPQDLKEYQIEFNKVYEKLYMEVGKLAEPHTMNCVNFKSFIRYSSRPSDAVEGALAVIESSITDLQQLSDQKCADKSKIVPSREFHAKLDTFTQEYRDKISDLENLIKDLPNLENNPHSRIENEKNRFNAFDSQIRECFPKP